MSLIEELQEAAATVSAKVSPAVVRIGREGNGRGGGRGGGRGRGGGGGGFGRGAGVVVGPSLVVTNAHNLRGSSVTVTFADGRQETGTVAGADIDGDLAVIQVPTGDIEPLEWADGPAEVGTPVFAVGGSPFGPRVTFGLVSAVGQAFRGPGGRLVGGSLEHTAPLQRGSSGGPVVDAGGRLLGINTNRLGEGFYLALPAGQELRTRVDRLAQGDVPTRRRLGVALVPSPAARHLRKAVGLPERDGVLVRAVEEGSPAEASGLREGDLLTSANGRDLRTPDDLFAVLDALSDDEPLTLHVVRGVDELEVAVRFDANGGEPGAA
ncbi:MAG TPA: trypsin-like peptidase domain-containing protein [Acidimicrobiia bacterium]|nr:trypsin-like peptidase domain-containing protein [Acidimicrobiia bacterium]